MSRTSFREVQEELTRRISEGEWRPGASIPGEESLANAFGCSRSTVNRALQEMARAGLVVRKRRAGTKVALHPVREARLVIPLVRQEIQASGATYLYTLLSQRVTVSPAQVCKRLTLPPRTPLLRVRCLHSADDVPYQYEDRWINPASVPSAVEAPFGSTSPNEWLVHNAPFTRASFHYLAEEATKRAANTLEIEEGAAVFVAERVTWLRDQPITFVRLIHRPGHRMVMDV